MEERVRLDPGDVPTRIKLVTSYFWRSEETAADRYRHVSWFIENLPHHPFLATNEATFWKYDFNVEHYAQLKDKWLATVSEHQDSAAIYKNAAALLKRTREDLPAAETLLMRARALCPDDLDLERDYCSVLALIGKLKDNLP